MEIEADIQVEKRGATADEVIKEIMEADPEERQMKLQGLLATIAAQQDIMSTQDKLISKQNITVIICILCFLVMNVTLLFRILV